MERLKNKMTIHIFRISILILLSLQASLASSSCGDKMKILNGAQEVTANVCVREYLTEDCETFSQTLNVSQLPEDGLRGKSVQRPSEFRVTEKFKSYSSGSGLTHRPGLAFQWKSPSSGDARDSIKGFYLRVQSEDGNQTVCRLFSINHTLYTGKLEFHYIIPNVSDVGRNYTAKIFSLPAPSTPAEMKDRENFKSSIVSVNNPFDSKFPAHWKTGISVTPDAEDRSIDVRFSLPERDLKYDFTNYTVYLLRANVDLQNYFRTETFFIPLRDEANTGHAIFTDLPLGNVYQVKVQPMDNYPDQDGLCLCHTIETFLWKERKICEMSCTISRSALFDLNGNINPSLNPTTSPPPLDNTTSDPTVQPTSEIAASTAGDDDDTVTEYLPLIIILSLLAVALIIGISAFLIIRRNRRKGRNYGLKFLPPVIVPEGKEGKCVVPDGPSRPKSVLGRKTVYLMFSSDHEYHQEMMKKFIAFLQTHCLCDVVVPSEMDIRQHPGGGASWLANKLSSCHCIIFMDSVGAYQRLKALGEQKRFRPTESGPEGDLFNLGLEHIYKELIPNSMTHQLILVSFTEELSKGQLFVSSEYLLPKYLSPFLQKLHNFGHHEVDAYKNCLPLMPDLIEELSEASALLAAIEEVKNFEQEFPEWFSRYYVLEKPKMDRITSIPESHADSDYSSLRDGPRSVSPTLRGSKTSDSAISSPTSDLGEPPMFDRNPECVTIVTQPTQSEVYDGASTLFSDAGEYDRHNTGHIVPPSRGIQEVHSDQFSNVLRDLNRDALSSRPGGEKIQPPRGLPSSSDGISRWLRDINVNNSVRPPRDELPIADGDGVSSVLRNINSETVMFSKDEAGDKKGRDDAMNGKILPPRNQMHVEAVDSFSSVLRNLNS